MGIALVAATLILGQSGPTVSFAADSVTVGALVKALAKQSGERLDATMAISAEPIVVDFRARSLTEIKGRLAENIGAVWIDQGGVSTLSRPAALVTEQARQERRQMADFLTALFDKRLEKFQRAGAFTRADADKLVDRYRLVDMKAKDLMAEESRIAQDNPIVRCAVKVLRSVDPTKLVQMRLGQRMVFSDVPTAVQVPLTAKGREAFTDLRKEIAVMEEAKKALGNPQKKLINFADHPVTGPAKTTDPYGKALLAIQRYGPLDFTYSLVLVAKDGRRLAQGSGYVPELRTRWDIQVPKEGTPLEIPEDAVAMGQLEMRGGGVSSASSTRVELGNGKFVWASFWVPFAEANQDDPATRVRAKLIEPVANDPLGVIAGSVLRKIAARRKQSLIASLGDRTLRELARQYAGQGVETEEGFWTVLRQDSIEESQRVPLANVSEEAGWIDVRPLFPVDARATRFDRKALRELIAEFRKEGALTMAAATRYGRVIRRVGLDYIYAVNADPAVGPSEVGSVFSPAMPFLIDLSPQQWTRFETDAIVVSQLSAGQREEVRRWVYESLTYAFRDRAERTSRNPMQLGQLPLALEPTELYPNGLPAALRVKVDRTERPRILTQSTLGLRYTMDPASLGMLEAMQRDPARHPEAARRSLTGYRPATEVGYSIKLQFGPEDEIGLSASETRPVPGSKFGLRSGLPESVLKEVEEVREAYRPIPRSSG